MSDRYEVLTGLDYHPKGDLAQPERRAEVGDIVDDLPPQSLSWLRADGHVRAAPMALPAAPAKRGKGD